jgi:DUF4097 and DUF4098 domain-containing protein YvlB
MASATRIPTTPPPPPPLPPRPPRSLAGPIVLIVIGLFFLLGNLRVLYWHDILRWFAHYWPVLLILWGIIKLIEYQQANRAGTRPRGIGAGGVMLIIFLVVAGLIATEAYNVNWPELRDQMHFDDGDTPWWGHTYEFNNDVQQAFAQGASLRVTSTRGAVNVTASNDNQIHVTVHKRISAESQDDANNWDKQTQPKLTASGQVVTLEANTQGSGDHWVNTDLDVALPRKAAVIISTRHGDVSIMGRDGSADVTDQSGDVSVTDLNGSLKLDLDHSSARLSQISSDVTIQGRANDVSVEDVKGTVHLDGDFMESVKLSRVAKPVSFKSTRTDMDFSQLEGYLNLDSGDLEGNNVVGPFRLRTRSKDVMLNGVSNDVHVEDENGAVEIHVNKVGSIDVRNAKGDIRIYVPERAGFQVDAQARDGEIQSDFSQLKIDNGDEHSTATGSVNGGGPRFVLSNEHGTIEIRKGGAIPPAPPAVGKAPRGPNPPDVPEPTEN